MLIQFSVKNYKSFKDKAIFSMEAGVNKELSDNVVEANGDRILRSAVVFGANASGKSNIFLALTAALLAIRQSVYNQQGSPVWSFTPFKFSEETIDAPSEFEFVFTHKGIKYVYGFSSTSHEVKEEHLYAYKSARPSTIFQREGEDYYFPESIKGKMAPLVERNLPNKLFISTSAAWNCPYTKDAMEWLMTGIDTYDTQFENTMPKATYMFENDSDGSLKQFTENLLRQADINISDFRFITEEKTQEEYALENNIPKSIKDFLFSGFISGMKLNSVECEMIHEVETEYAKKRYTLNIEEESLGTKKLFMFTPFIKKALDNGLVIFADEFDTSLHPLLLKHIISLFHNSSINKNNAQLIISTHAMDLLDLELYRRDQIYFVDKDRDTSASSLYSLDEFSIRASFTKLRESYLNGRFDAVPHINKGDVF